MKHQFKIGDKILIGIKPTHWASRLCQNNPLDECIFPFECIIEDLYNDEDYIAMKAGDYGWDLTTLINTSNISKFNIDIYQIY